MARMARANGSPRKEERLDNALTLLFQTGVMFVIAFVGYTLVKTGKISLEGGRTIANILIYVSLPSLIVNGFLVERTPEKIAELGYATLAAALGLVLCIGLSRLVCGKDPIANFAGSFCNPGFFGIALITAILGEGATFYLTPLIAMINMGQWTYGVSLMTGQRGKISAKRVFTAPFMVAILVGLFFFFTGLPMPRLAAAVLKQCGNLNTPLAMFSVGIYLSQCDLKKMFARPVLYRISLARLIVIPAAVLLVMTLLRFVPQDIRLTMLIALATPVGSNIAVYAQLYDGDYAYSVQTVVISTLLSIVTMPLFVMAAGALW